MVLSEAQKRDAYREAQQILRLDEKYTKAQFPTRSARDFEEGAGAHDTTKRGGMNIHGGLMHEHGPREARLLERTLRAGVVHPDVLHSFQHNITKADPNPAPVTYDLGDDPELPDFDLYVHDAGQTIVPASHYEPGRDIYHASEHEPDSHVPLVPAPKQPEQARLPSSYEAVH